MSTIRLKNITGRSAMRPDLAVYDGSDLLGRIITDKGQFRAETADGRALGTFARPDKAVAAIRSAAGTRTSPEAYPPSSTGDPE